MLSVAVVLIDLDAVVTLPGPEVEARPPVGRVSLQLGLLPTVVTVHPEANHPIIVAALCRLRVEVAVG